ncbi:MAG: IPT/TIG domain-containing protein, partial [Nitrospirota bacterium]|nr:IPT/TIG domain-containing protein [Nitrospirota bacterium]
MMTREGMRRFMPVNLFLLSLSLLSCSTSGGANSSCLDGSARLRSLNEFRAADAIPTITSISTQRGPAEGAVQGGTPVFVRGSNFGADTVVLFGDKASPCTLVQDSSFIIAEAGPVLLSGLVDVTVTTGGQISVKPDGFRYTPLLAFSSDRTGNFEIFTMSIDGFDIKQVTNNALGQGQQPLAGEINKSPAFSLDGKDIAYASNKGNEGSETFDIFISSRTGANPKNLTQTSAATDINPVFSPDGNFIVFASTLSIAGSNPGG